MPIFVGEAVAVWLQPKIGKPITPFATRRNAAHPRQIGVNSGRAGHEGEGGSGRRQRTWLARRINLGLDSMAATLQLDGNFAAPKHRIPSAVLDAEGRVTCVLQRLNLSGH